MAVSLGLDIGSNSVGAAWVDTDKQLIRMGVGVFPAGVDETELQTRVDLVGWFLWIWLKFFVSRSNTASATST